MSYQLSKRTGHIGTSINGRREMHGEEPVPFMDISFSVLVTVAEAAKITGDSHLAERWFDTHDGKLKGKFENSRATAWVGVNALEIKFPLVRFASLSFDPQKVGSMVELKFKIQSLITNKNNEIFLWMDRDAEIELQFGELQVKEVQEEMELQGGGVVNGNEVEEQGEEAAAPDEDAPATLEDALAADSVCAHGNPMGEDCDQCDAARIGTPEEEREKARLREVSIAQQLEADRNQGKPKRRSSRARGADAVN